MKNLVLIFTVLMGLVLASCSSDEPLVRPDDSVQAVSSNKYRKSIDQALNAADRMFAQIDRNSQTRSTTPRRVASIQVIDNSDGVRTRGSADEDTMLYLVNYADEQGFALLSSDWRTKPVYAISDEGHLNISDTTFNKGLALFMENTRADYNYNVNGAGSSRPDSIIGIVKPGIDHPVDPGFNYELKVKRDVKPILTYHQSRWDQAYPFYKYCFNDAGEKCLVGCVAVAFTQMVSTKGVPATIGGRTLNWEVINNLDPWYAFGQDIDNLFYFMAKIGESPYLYMQYGPSESKSNIYHAQNTLYALGIANSSVQDFIGLPPVDAYPLMMVADRNDINSGHAWVLDGAYYYTEISDFYVDGKCSYYFEHCVWGWGGKANGYYSWSSGKGFGSKPHHYDDNDEGNEDATTGLFVKNAKYLYLK